MNYLKILFLTLSTSISLWAHAAPFNIEKWHTKNGVQVIFYPAPEIPMLDISIAFAAGSAYDDKLFGLSALTSQLLDQGNAGYNATSIAESLADVGSQYSQSSGKDMVVYNLRTLTETHALNQSLDIFSKILNRPDFVKKEIEHQKKQFLRAIELSKESPEDIAEKTFFKRLYQEHPYAHSVYGTKKTIKAITRPDILNFYHHYYVGKNATLVLVGALDGNKAHEIAEQITYGLKSGNAAESITQAPQLKQASHLNKTFPSAQTMIRLGQIGIDHHAPDYFSLVVGNYILGGGTLLSRLGVEVREKRGLTYGIDSQFAPMHGEGPFLISLSTRSAQSHKAVNLIQKVLQEFIEKGPLEDELIAAKKYLIGSFPLSLSSNRNIASILLRMHFYQLPENYLETYTKNINAVNLKAIKTSFKNHVNPDRLLLVTVGES